MKQFTQKIQEQFNKMSQTGKLFTSSLSGQQVWDLYLNSFEADPIFRDPESSEHNCKLCNNFIRRYGNIVAIDANYEIITMFDIEGHDEFIPVVKALSKALKSVPVAEVFFETYDELNSLNYEKCNKNNISMINGSNTINLYYYEINMVNKYPIKGDGSKNYTYEQALEEGLYKALELIKN